MLGHFLDKYGHGLDNPMCVDLLISLTSNDSVDDLADICTNKLAPIDFINQRKLGESKNFSAYPLYDHRQIHNYTPKDKDISWLSNNTKRITRPLSMSQVQDLTFEPKCCDAREYVYGDALMVCFDKCQSLCIFCSKLVDPEVVIGLKLLKLGKYLSRKSIINSNCVDFIHYIIGGTVTKSECEYVCMTKSKEFVTKYIDNLFGDIKKLPDEGRKQLAVRGFHGIVEFNKSDLKHIAMCDDDEARLIMLDGVSGNLNFVDTFQLFANKSTRTLLRLKGRLEGLDNVVLRDVDDIKLIIELGYCPLNKIAKLMISGVKVPPSIGELMSDLSSHIFEYYISWLQPENGDPTLLLDCCDVPLHLYNNGYSPVSCMDLDDQMIYKYYDTINSSDKLARLRIFKWSNLPYDHDRLYTMRSIEIAKHIDEMIEITTYNIDIVSLNYKIIFDIRGDAFAKRYLKAISELNCVSGLLNIEPNTDNLSYLMENNKTMFKELVKRY